MSDIPMDSMWPACVRPNLDAGREQARVDDIGPAM